MPHGLLRTQCPLNPAGEVPIFTEWTAQAQRLNAIPGGSGLLAHDQCLFWVQAHTASVTRQEDSGGLPEGRVPGTQEQFEAEQA